MRLHRFFLPDAIGNRTEISVRSKELTNQIRRVFRLKPGDETVLFDGSGSEYTCAIASFAGDDGVVFDVRASARAHYMPMRHIHLYAAIVKKDNFELIVEKATELGVTDVIPVMAERTEKKALNEERLKRIAIEASEQSGRGDVPAIHPIASLKDAVEGLRGRDDIHVIAFHTEGELFDPDEIADREPAAVFIGPEGGWSHDEIDLFHRNEIAVRCLGNQVLRAETAVIAALSQVVFRV